jgi:hypothetical protein
MCPAGRLFRENLRMYNNTLSLCSLGARIDNSVSGQSGVYTFRIQGALYHRIGSLLPVEGEQPRFAQIYFSDSDPHVQLRHRLAHAHGLLDPDVLLALQNMLQELNPYYERCMTAFERLRLNPSESFKLTTVNMATTGRDPRTYNRPTAAEVGVLMPGTGEDVNSARDIVIQLRGGPDTLRRVSELHSAYCPLRFPLLFPYGEQGWQPEIPLGENTAAGNAQRRDTLLDGDNGLENQPRLQPRQGRGGSIRVSQCQFYAFYLHIRPSTYSILHRSSRLFQEYIVDAWAQIEHGRLLFIQLNQNKLRCELYDGLQDAVLNGASLSDIGRRVILPSTFSGSHVRWQLFTKMP